MCLSSASLSEMPSRYGDAEPSDAFTDPDTMVAPVFSLPSIASFRFELEWLPLTSFQAVFCTCIGYLLIIAALKQRFQDEECIGLEMGEDFRPGRKDTCELHLSREPSAHSLLFRLLFRSCSCTICPSP
jgi:hypothetical protein